MLSLSEVTLICENRQKYAHFESLICEKKFWHKKLNYIGWELFQHKTFS